ncbi:MAG: TetR/AcrR family transcriptional regulator [Actinomycetota bacterium]|nr:TetR/AcrR family transcriptional regulator [Actinomycetota bacterium]
MNFRAEQGVEEKERRGRLNRAVVLSAALDLIDRDGLEELSMRRLASHLAVSPMALYNHVPHKEALLEGVVDRILGEIDLSVVELDDWAEVLKSGFRSFQTTLLRHPNAVPLLQSKVVVTPDSLRPVEVSLATLQRAGFDARLALHAHWALVGFTFGHVTNCLANPLTNPGVLKESVVGNDSLGPGAFPSFHRCLPHCLNPDFDASYEFGLEIIIEGLRAQLLTERSDG